MEDSGFAVSFSGFDMGTAGFLHRNGHRICALALMSRPCSSCTRHRLKRFKKNHAATYALNVVMLSSIRLLAWLIWGLTPAKIA